MWNRTYAAPAALLLLFAGLGFWGWRLGSGVGPVESNAPDGGGPASNPRRGPASNPRNPGGLAAEQVAHVDSRRTELKAVSSSLELQLNVGSYHRMPDRWVLRVDDVDIDCGPGTSVTVQPEQYPARLEGKWGEVQLFSLDVKAPGRVSTTVKPRAQLVLTAPKEVPGSWTVYFKKGEFKASRGLRIETIRVDESRPTAVLVDLEEEATRFSAWHQGFPPDVFTSSDLAQQPWTKVHRTLRTPRGGRIVVRVADTLGDPVSELEIEIVSLYPESFSKADFMILDAPSTRWLGGFCARVKTGANGEVTFDGVPVGENHPFVVLVRSRGSRISDPRMEAPRWTKFAQTTYVDLIVRR
ncbi:MAG: hypothetical protein ACYTGW_15905 [Planctomycetota bacterium]|jgi:hypothetical protein